MTIKEKRLEKLNRAFKTWQAKEKDRDNSYAIEYESLPMDLIQDIKSDEINYLPNFAWLIDLPVR